MARVAFAYPEGDELKWQAHFAEQRAAEKQASHDAGLTPAAVAVGNLCFDYAVKGGDENLRPVRVFDDGAKTYIQMPLGVQNRQAPALVILGQDGKGELVNYRVKDQLYVVDRLFDHAQLILGSGKKAQKVEITRERK
jgi:type IV secretion system protein VirB9